MAKVLIDMPDYMLNQITMEYPFELPSRFVSETFEIIKNGTVLTKGQFIAICKADCTITEKVENTLKETGFIGGDEEEDMYCFVIKEIIKADDDKIVRVGDEIYSELTDSKAVVHHIDAWNRYQCFTDNGSQFILDKHTLNDYWVKTGRNYPQIAEVLKQMNEVKE
ncbi:MAG: hypothetical protein LIR46_08080 [Bacteroidota bacterium]|nr:hypothetical protein [Bacteroidota bacterium]